VTVFERIRRLFHSEPGPDHPLSEEEREGVPQTTTEESASLLGEFAGGSEFDPDANERS
jgi:hypothetical protein